MSIKLVSPREAAISQGIKALVHGPSGAGKTTLCATCEEPTLIISAEAGLLSIRNTESDIKVAEVGSVDEIMDVYTWLKEGQDFQWICLDSLSEIAEVVLANEKRQTKDPRQAYGALIDQMGGMVRAFRDLPYNVLVTAKQERIQDEAGSLLYMPAMPGSKLGQQLPYWFDLVLAMRVEKDQEGEIQRWLQTNRDVTHEAKDRSGALDLYERPNMSEIAAKIRGVN